MLHLLAVAIPSNAVIEWTIAHIHWPFIVAAAWKASQWLSEVKAKANTVATQVDLLTTNHFPHMEASLARQDAYLENIDRNIGRMADKL